MIINVKVSIVVPIYNVEQYIAECLHSLFKQTYQYIEFIFVDDASPDNSVSILKKIVKEYENVKDRVILIQKEKNEGTPQARKTGVERATGDYIIYADPDDYLEYDMIEKMIGKAISGDFDIVWCDYFENERYVNACPKTDDKIEIFKGMLNFDLHGAGWNKLVKRSIYFNEIYFPKFRRNEDIVISVQNLFHAKKIGFLNTALYHYRIHSCSISLDKTKRVERATGYYKNIAWVVNFLENKFDGNLEFLEPHLSYRINHIKMKIMEIKETRDVKKLYEFYPKSLDRLFVRYKKLTTFIQAVMLFLATKNVLFPYKLLDIWRKFH
jgi:glycosyltransferase involved in cell wall biosynthesis